MADLDFNQRSDVTQITGSDEQFTADVIQEDGVNKLAVKSTIVPQVLGNIIFIYAENGGSSHLNVNGSGTPVEFIINPPVTGDAIVASLTFQAFDGGIKVDTFLGQNSELSNGVIVEVKSEDVVFQFIPIRNTIEFDSLFAVGSGRSFELITASGNDSLVSRFGPNSPFLLKEQGTFGTDDYIKVIIQDNLSNIARLRFLAEGNIDV